MHTHIRLIYPLLLLVISLVPTLAAAQTGLYVPGAPSGSGITPSVVGGNPKCSDLGYAFGFKPQPEPPPAGTYSDGQITVTLSNLVNPDDPACDAACYNHFDWSSSLGVDAVIVKGGADANVYVYAPESLGDTGLHTPLRISNNKHPDVSHIEFCYDLEVGVRKDAETSFTRTYDWTIDKEGDQTELVLSPGQADAPVHYTVTVTPNATDGNWEVHGAIWIHNPAAVPVCGPTPASPGCVATITGVSDVVSPSIAAGVVCGVSFPHALGPGQDLHCTYSANLPDGSNRTNTATVTTSGSIGGGTATAPVTFGAPILIDECIDVSDPVAGGFLGTVCATESPGSTSFEYTVNVAAFIGPDVCRGTAGDYHTTFENTASFVTNDTGATGQDSWVVNVVVRCAAGCTLTQGYWKTHSERGPAPYDDTWNKLPGTDAVPNAGDDGSGTPFFLSGQTYYQVMWTPPQGGNAYYILAHQYIAARLNVLNGASVPAAVQTALNTAAGTGYFLNRTPAQVAALKGATRQAWINLAGILAGYNEGLTGPGHCSEGTPATPKRSSDEAAAAASDELDARVTAGTEEVPATFSLGQNYPNPFNPSTAIRLELTEAAPVKLVVYDVLGRHVATLVDGTLEAGRHEVTWDASGLPSGTYLYVARAGALTQVRQMVLLK